MCEEIHYITFITAFTAVYRKERGRNIALQVTAFQTVMTQILVKCVHTLVQIYLFLFCVDAKYGHE